MDWKLEVVVLPVSDVDRAKQFYSEQVGFVVDVDHSPSEAFRVVQLTPPGSGCSVTIGKGLSDAAPGSVKGLQLVVSDVAEARRQLVERGVAVSPVRHMDNGAWKDGHGGPWNSFIFFDDPDGNSWVVQEKPMSLTIDTPTYHPEDESLITRVFAAPRELVFKAWTEADHMARWWAPQGGTVEVHRLDARPGGLFHYAQQSPGGPVQWGRFEFREVVPPERLVYVSSFSDAEGNVARAPWSDSWPLEILNILTLTEQHGQTTMELRGGPINANEAERAAFAGIRPMLAQGFEPFFATLDALLAER